MMSFEDFQKYVAGQVRNYLPTAYMDADVFLHKVTKVNDRDRTGLVINPADRLYSPVLYLEDYYHELETGRHVRDILQGIADHYVRWDLGLDQPDRESVLTDKKLRELLDFDQVKDKILCRLINAEMNEKYLADKPYTKMEDLAVIYGVDLGGGENESLMMPITERLQSQYGLTTKELHEIALDNLSKSEIRFWATFPEFSETSTMSPEEAMAEAMRQGEPPLYVLTNENYFCGAAAVLNRRRMDCIARQLGGDFVVLPSSIHEVLILPADGAPDRQTLEFMVRSTNAEVVNPGERLSDHVYQYDFLAHELVRMDELEKRRSRQTEARQTETHENTSKKRKPKIR